MESLLGVLRLRAFLGVSVLRLWDGTTQERQQQREFGCDVWRCQAKKKTFPLQDADMAMTQFNHIITNHLFNFPPAYYGVGKALVLLHNHTEARVHIKRALELLPSYRAAPLTWPGTSTIMVECMPHDVEVRGEGGTRGVRDIGQEEERQVALFWYGMVSPGFPDRPDQNLKCSLTANHLVVKLGLMKVVASSMF